MSGSSIDLNVSGKFLIKMVEATVLFEETDAPLSELFRTASQEMERLIKAVTEERAALATAERRYVFFRTWFIRAGTRTEVYPYCHIIKQPTAAMVDQAIDEAGRVAATRAERLGAPYEQDEEG
jgi:hypothetical protein